MNAFKQGDKVKSNVWIYNRNAVLTVVSAPRIATITQDEEAIEEMEVSDGMFSEWIECRFCRMA